MMKNRSHLLSVPLLFVITCLFVAPPLAVAQETSSESEPSAENAEVENSDSGDAAAGDAPDSIPVDASDEESVQTRSPVDDEGRIVDFQRDIAPILRDKCLKCHGPKDAKNDFRVDDSETMLSYIDGGDVESTLYVDYLITEDEDLMMPPPSQGGPLSSSELALIRVWIAEGANWPEDANISGAEESSPAESMPAPQSLPERVWAFQGFLHPATVHFPIAFFMLGALFVVLGVKWKSVGTQIPLACLLLGAPAAVVAALMGWAFATEQGYPGWSTIDMDKEWFWHRWSGVIVAAVAVVVAIIALKALKSGSTKLTATWKIGLLLLAGMVGAVGHQGGEMRYGGRFYERAFDILLGKSDEAAKPDNTVMVDDVPDGDQEPVPEA